MPLETVEQARQRRCGERLAALMQEHREQPRPVVLDMIADDLAELIGLSE